MIVQLLKEQIKCDEIPSSLLGHLEHILPLAEQVTDEIVCEETEILAKIVLQMFEVMQKIAKFLCEYIRHGRVSRRSLFWILQMLMIAERAKAAIFSLKDKDRIKEMDEELANVIKHFLNAVDVKTLRQAKSTGKYSLSQYSVHLMLMASCRAEAATQAA